MAEYNAGLPKYNEYKKADEDHLLETTGKQLRKLMSWVDETADDAPGGAPGEGNGGHVAGRAGRAPRVTVDDYLGPAERRFFGQGYKRAEQRLTGISVGTRPDGKGFARGRAAVRYPDDWSRKGSVDQLPHLSTIDVLLLAGEATELYLTHALGLDPAQRRTLVLRRVRIKAGRVPVEEELGDFGVNAVISAPRDVDTSGSGRLISTADCQVGALRVRLDIEHPPGATASPSATYADPDALLGSGGLRPYAQLHTTKTQVMEDLDVNVRQHTAHAVTSVRSTAPDTLVAEGLESSTYRATSVVDAFVVALQLGQILLYELDAVPRAESNTMWMRQTVLEVGEPRRPVVGPGRITVRLENTELLTTGTGETWRSADVVGRLDHLSIRCSIAHRLP
jgi:hypothetical protein